MAQGGEVSLQPSELVRWLEAKLSEKSIRLNSKQRQALEGIQKFLIDEPGGVNKRHFLNFSQLSPKTMVRVLVCTIHITSALP